MKSPRLQGNALMFLMIPALAFFCAYLVMGAPSGSGSIDGFELGKSFGWDLDNLARKEASPSGVSVERLAELLHYSPDPKGFRSYTATTELKDVGRLELEIGVLPFQPAPGQNAHLAVAWDSGNKSVQKSVMWGRPGFESQGWASFLGQFNGRRLDAESLLGRSEIEGLARSLPQASSPKERTIWALYQLQHAMRANTYHMTISGAESPPDAERYRRWKKNLAGLAALAPELKNVLGAPLAEDFANFASKASSLVDPVIETASTGGSVSQVRSQVFQTLYRQGCRRCHGLQAPQLGERTIYWTVRANLGRFGARQDLFQVGLDVWSYPEEPEASQRIADAVKAALILIGE